MLWLIGSLSHYLQGFSTIPGGDRRISAINSMVVLWPSQVSLPEPSYRGDHELLLKAESLRLNVKDPSFGTCPCGRWVFPWGGRAYSNPQIIKQTPVLRTISHYQNIHI